MKDRLGKSEEMLQAVDFVDCCDLPVCYFSLSQRSSILDEDLYLVHNVGHEIQSIKLSQIRAIYFQI